MQGGDARSAIARELADICPPSHRSDLDERLQRLSDKELTILLRRMKGKSLEQVARELCISPSRVSQLAKRALNKFCEEPRKGARHDDA